MYPFREPRNMAALGNRAVSCSAGRIQATGGSSQPAPKAYLDMKYNPTTELGLRWAGYVDLRTAYDWDPTTYTPALHADNVLGVEAPLWTETVPNITAAEYLLVPRLPALAEVGA